MQASKMAFDRVARLLRSLAGLAEEKSGGALFLGCLLVSYRTLARIAAYQKKPGLYRVERWPLQALRAVCAPVLPVHSQRAVSADAHQHASADSPLHAIAAMPKQATKAATAALSGAGQHYALALELPIGADAKEVTLSWALPAAAYVDKDEVESRGSWPACINKVQFTGNSDVEAQEFEAEAHRVRLRIELRRLDVARARELHFCDADRPAPARLDLVAVHVRGGRQRPAQGHLLRVRADRKLQRQGVVLAGAAQRRQRCLGCCLFWHGRAMVREAVQQSAGTRRRAETARCKGAGSTGAQAASSPFLNPFVRRMGLDLGPAKVCLLAC